MGDRVISHVIKMLAPDRLEGARSAQLTGSTRPARLAGHVRGDLEWLYTIYNCLLWLCTAHLKHQYNSPPRSSNSRPPAIAMAVRSVALVALVFAACSVAASGRVMSPAGSYKEVRAASRAALGHLGPAILAGRSGERAARADVG